MQKQSVKELGRLLPDRIRLLSRLIARKPASFTPDWATTVEDSFLLYTNTSTINLLHSLNQGLIHFDWPFPAYLDLRKEMAKTQHAAMLMKKRSKWLSLPGLIYRGPSLAMILMASGSVEARRSNGQATCDALITYVFRKQKKAIFAALSASSVLKAKQRLVDEISEAYRRKLWAACISTTVPLLDFAMRSFFGTRKLNVSIQILRDAFIREAKLRPKDLMPGSAIWDGQRDPDKGNAFAGSIEEDLRLPGILLSSFFEFADRYYEWYKSTEGIPGTPLNRHAVMHCSSEFWSEANAVRIITFLHLTLELELPLRILIHGDSAVHGVACATQ